MSDCENTFLTENTYYPDSIEAEVHALRLGMESELTDRTSKQRRACSSSSAERLQKPQHRSSVQNERDTYDPGRGSSLQRSDCS